MHIQGPSPNGHPKDRFTQCEEALETAFQMLLWKALKAGWDEGETCAAIASLADHHILSRLSTNEVLRRIDSADPNRLSPRRST